MCNIMYVHNNLVTSDLKFWFRSTPPPDNKNVHPIISESMTFQGVATFLSYCVL